jgi:hypothetical protein
MPRAVAVLVCSLILTTSAVWGGTNVKTARTSPMTVDDAIAHIRRSIDPCGESAQIVAVLERFQRCSTARVEIRTSATAVRNLFDRPLGSDGTGLRTITWNPRLRSELERGCGGDPDRPVLRDPTASLLHEIVHAAQDCEGLNPAEHEFEAVRLENVYRRAAGLCQRERYGDDPLPRDMRRTCAPGDCPCTSPELPTAEPPDAVQAAADDRPPSPAAQGVGDSVPRPVRGDETQPGH